MKALIKIAFLNSDSDYDDAYHELRRRKHGIKTKDKKTGLLSSVRNMSVDSYNNRLLRRGDDLKSKFKDVSTGSLMNEYIKNHPDDIYGPKSKRRAQVSSAINKNLPQSPL